MPYTPKQHKLFQAAAHNPKIAAKHGMGMDVAKRLSKEPVKKAPAKTAKKK
jgi:hypothetical protein